MTEETQKATTLTIQDIQFAVNVIDAVTKRGAFNGDEMMPVGILRQKFVDFLVSAGVGAEQPQEQDEVEEETPSE